MIRQSKIGQRETRGTLCTPMRRTLAAFIWLIIPPLAQADLSFETLPNLGLVIADQAYNGTLSSMTCTSIPVTSLGGYLVEGLTVTAWLEHTWIGDLVIKVQGPGGIVVTLLSRPGVFEYADDGSGAVGFGDSSNLVSTDPIEFIDGGAKSAESMGDSLGDAEAVCRDDSACVYDPNRGAALGGNLSDFIFRAANGTWKFCAGDSGQGDVGAIQKVRLTFVSATPAMLGITPQIVDFGALEQGATSAVRFVKLENNGSEILTINSLTEALPPFQRTTDGTCSSSLPFDLYTNQACTVSYIFSPQTQDEAAQSFTVLSNAAGDSGFALNGSGDAIFADGFEP